MIKSTGKHRKGYVQNPEYRLQITCIINNPVHLSDECKVLGYFGSKCAKVRPT